MTYESISEPAPMSEAFHRFDDVGVLSQAAVLLTIRADKHASVSDASPTELDSLADEPDRDEVLRVPRLADPDVYASSSEAAAFIEEVAGPFDRVRPAVDLEEGFLSSIAGAFESEPTTRAAGALSMACLEHTDPTVRAAAAGAYFELVSDPVRPLDVLREAATAEEPLARDVARTILADILPEDPLLQEFIRGPEPPGGPGGLRSTMLVHGTWARGGDWWRPGGDFYEYLAGEVFDEEAARLQAGIELRHVFAHPERWSVYSPGMSEMLLRATHEVIARLFPQESDRTG